jgi:hypothetical protein
MERHTWYSILDIRTTLLIHPNTCTAPSCNCKNGLCNQVTQQCSCQSGWLGAKCDVKACTGSCKNGLCNPLNGDCACYKGWSGDNCDIRSCNYHGVPYNDKCACDNFYLGDDCDGCSGKSGDKFSVVCVQTNNQWDLNLFSNSDAPGQLKKPSCSKPGDNNLDCLCRPAGKTRRQNGNLTTTSTIQYYQQRTAELDALLKVYIKLNAGSKLSRSFVLVLMAFLVQL